MTAQKNVFKGPQPKGGVSQLNSLHGTALSWFILEDITSGEMQIHILIHSQSLRKMPMIARRPMTDLSPMENSLI
jgi:hypothetical protein